MNSTNHQCCCSIEAEAGPSQLSKPDNNANLMNQTQRNPEYKGAIPKTKPAVKIKTTSSSTATSTSASKKTTKQNNNLEEVPNLANSAVQQSDMLQVNGVSLHPYYPTEDFSEPKVITSSSESKINDLVTISTSNGIRNKDSSYFQFSDDDDTLSISDDGCIYTYKGDQDADLPVSFFSMPIESPNPINRRQSASPEMDFLEMDFDPGPTGEDFDNTNAQSVIKDGESQKKEKDEENLASSSIEIDKKNCCSGGERDKSLLINSRNNMQTKDKKPINNSYKISPSKDLHEVKNQETHVKMPWTCNISERTTASTTSSLTKKYHCTKGELLSPTTTSTATTPDVPQKTQNGKNCDEKSCVECYTLEISSDSETVMIWTEQEACLKQISQIGPSACGATAVLNALKALKRPAPTREKINGCMTTRLRANTSPLTQYLLSRSVAGTTHADLIDCLHKITDGQVYARFFHMFPERVVNLRRWLAFWIGKGAVPIATLNLQKCTTPTATVPDAWHHQMIFGVGPKWIYLCNPIERVSPESLWNELCSESVLLVRREDVLSRWNVKVDLPELMKIRNHRWRSMNVVGQVANLIFESRRELRLGFKNTSHIKIPASYSSGITLVIPTNSPSCSLLRHCPELPILSMENVSK